ncbi:hypothetical protein EYV94_15090 [Puteibacter caeruleilacunae]|nr:hypothetical protein EYV94_15090 [Puteibacter caeruleilacunae]
MKTLIFISLLTVFSSAVNAQKLIDIYKSGSVELVADENYAKNNDWNKILETYNDTIYGKHMGNRKSIKIFDDGSLIINHAYRNFYTKLGPDGKFVKEFTVTKENGKKVKTNHVAGILEGSICYSGLTNMGTMTCFDADGHFIKNLTLDYMSKDMIPLPGKKIAVVGWAIWKDRFRDFVAIVDYETNEEKIIWNHYTPRDNSENDKNTPFSYSYKFKKGGMIGHRTMPFMNNLGLRPAPMLSYSNNKLIIAIPPTGEILEFSLDGKKIGTKKVSWPSKHITIEEQQTIQKKSIQGLKDRIANNSESKKPLPEEMIEAYKSIQKDMEADLSKIKDPIAKPFFSSIITDSDGNILFFEYPEDEGANKFNVYALNQEGKFVCSSTFKCDDYDLVINPGKMVFHKGYIYAICHKKDATGIPLRVVRFKLSN